MNSIDLNEKSETNESILMYKNQQIIQNAILNSQQDKEIRQQSITFSNSQSQKITEDTRNTHISLMLFNSQQNDLEKNNIDSCIFTSVRNKLQPYFGTLLKKSPHWVQGYQERQCSIINRVFRYYSAESRKLEGVLNFDVQTYKLIDVNDKYGNIIEFSIKPVGKIDKIFYFKGANSVDTKIWFDIIKLHLQDSLGATNTLSTLCLIDRYWRYERISAQQLEEEAEDGDIILFRGKDINCYIQRAFTQDDYDHVGILIKLDNNELYIFEALPSNGVGLCKWRIFNLKQWYTLYQKVVYRRLKVNRTSDFKVKLSDFVNENLGKKYSCTPSKLLMQQSILFNDLDYSKDQYKNRTYFCSELVAKCYKSLGLLPQKISSTQYWPGSFSQKNNKFKLQNAELSEEYLIDFQM